MVKKLLLNISLILTSFRSYWVNIELKKYNSEVVGFKGDRDRIPKADTLLDDNQIWKRDNFEAKIYHIPGHTKGHIAFHFFNEKKIFTETLCFLGCGRILREHIIKCLAH